MAASWGSHIWQSHRDVGRLLGASKVSRVLGGMAAVNLDLHQAPGENMAGHLASKSAGHVSKHALPYCLAPRDTLRCT